MKQIEQMVSCLLSMEGSEFEHTCVLPKILIQKYWDFEVTKRRKC